MQKPFPEHWFSAYVDGELSDAEREQVERALAEQPEYRQLVDELTAMRSALRRLPRESFEGDVRERVLQRAERAMFEPASLAAAKVKPKPASSSHEPALAAAPAARSRRSRTRLIAALLATSAALLLAYVAFFSQTAPQTIAVHMLAKEVAAPEQMAAQRKESADPQRPQSRDHDLAAAADDVWEDGPAGARGTDGRAPVEQPLEGEALGIAPAHADADEYDDYGDSASAVAESRYRDRLYEPEEQRLLREDVAAGGDQQRDHGLMFGSFDDDGPLSAQPYDAILYVTLHPEASDRKIIQEALETLSPIATDDAERATLAQVSEVDAARAAHPPPASGVLSGFQVPDSEKAETPTIESRRFATPGAGEQEPLRELHLRLASHEQLQEAVERLRSLKPDVLEVHLASRQPSLGFGYFPSERMERYGLGGMGGYGGLGGMGSVGAGIRGREAEAEAESPKQSAESKPEAFYDITPPRLPRRGRLQEDQPEDRRRARPRPADPAPAEPVPAEPEVAERIRAESADPESEQEVAEEAERNVLDDAAAPQHDIEPPARANERAGGREVKSGLPVQPDGLPPGALDAASVDAEAEIEEAPVPKASTPGASQFFSHTVVGPMPPGATPALPYRLPADSERQTLRILIVVQPGESDGGK